MSRRQRQLGEFLKEEITDIIRRDVDDPRIGFFSVTRVDISPDLRSAQVFISVLGTETERRETLTALQKAAGFIRHHLKPRMHTRQIPDLDFRDDHSMEHADQIARAFKSIQQAPAPTNADKQGEG